MFNWFFFSSIYKISKHQETFKTIFHNQSTLSYEYNKDHVVFQVATSFCMGLLIQRRREEKILTRSLFYFERKIVLIPLFR